MIIFVILLFALILWKSKLNLNSDFDNHELFHCALERDSTESIKGICILYVFMRHVVGYIPLYPENYSDRLFYTFDTHTRQLLVVMFLFYSGYGVMEAIKRKGAVYVNSIPKRRVLTTLLNFDIAVAIFIILDLLLNIPLTWQQSLLAFSGWTSVGNSNWYIFCILFLYSATFISFRINKLPPPHVSLCRIIILTVLYIGVVQIYHGSWWVDTAMAYPAGVVFSMYKDKFERLFTLHYWLSCFLCLALFLLFYNTSWRTYFISENIYAVLFAFLVVLITMKWRIQNPALQWCGKHLFPLYIYQRLPMIILATICGGTLPMTQPYLFVTLSLVIAILITYLHKYIDIKLA